MGSRHVTAIVLLLALIAGSVGFLPAGIARATTAPQVAFAPIGTYNTSLGPSSAETVAVDRTLVFVTNSGNNSLDIVNIEKPTAPTLERRINLAPYGGGPNSVAVRGNLVAVAVEAVNKTDPGKVVLFDRTGRFLNHFTVGALPDMLTFSPKGDFILVANEGEPNSYGQPDSVDPEGSVSILPIWQGARRLPQANIKTLNFNKFERGGECEGDIDPRVRIFGPTAGLDNPRRISQNLEPEYITFSPDGRFAYVTLQENNGLAVIDMALEEFSKILYLGEKDHNLPGNGLDASDRDSRINIQNWPVLGMYQPDAIASFRTGGKNYLITANEGDARDYVGFNEEARVGSLSLDPVAFPNAAALRNNAALGRLTVTRANGDSDGDGDFDRLFAFGARSFTIWSDSGALVWDSGDQLEQLTANTLPTFFNSDGPTAPPSFDGRSDNKGPEPESVAVGRIGDRTYAFVGLERIGGVMIFDVTTPTAPVFVQYTNNADFTSGTGDRGPEVVVFVPAAQSPSGKARFVVANEISGTVTIYEQIDPNGAGTLTLLHNNDGESSLLPILYPGNLPVGSAAAYKTLSDLQIAQARAARNSVLNVYAGDSFLASSTLACSLPPNPATTPIYDAVAQRQMPYDAHILGNHEFDFSPDFLERFVRSFAVNGRLTQPFLSANLDFSREPGFADLLKGGDGVIVGRTGDGRVVAKSAILADNITAGRFGIVSATTPLLPTISSPRNVVVTSTDNASTAAVVQAEIDRLQNSYGVKKIIFVSHLQDLTNDRALIGLLRGVDIAVGGGGDELLANDPSQLLPGESQAIAGTYPLQVPGADGRIVYLVTTAGNYKYLGRLDATFDADGNVSTINAAASFPRRVIPTSSVAASLGLADTVTPDPGIVSSVETPVRACLAALGAPVAQTEVLLNVARGGGTPFSPGVRATETNAGNLIADSFVAAYDRYAAANGLPPRGPGNPVVAVQNGGGIRQNAGNVLPVGGAAPGPITRQNTLDVLAFLTNSVTVVNNVGAAQLKEIFERSAAVPGGGQFLQVSGFRVTLDYTRPGQTVSAPPAGEQAGTITAPGERVRELVYTGGTADPADDITLVTGGVVVDTATRFRVVTNSFTAAGGDNYPSFEEIPATSRVQFPATYEQAWVEYLLTFPVGSSGLPTVSAADPRYAPGGEGRITLIR